MNSSLTEIERQALGNLLGVLKGHGNAQWRTFITDWFDCWEPIEKSGISLSQYYRTLKSLSLETKRGIMTGVLLGWNEHHSFLTLYSCINSLIYLKVCETAEYFSMQQFYNFMTFFADLCQDEKQIEVTFSRRQWLYTIRFYKEESLETYGIIDFQLAPPESSDQIVAIVPWYGLLKNKLDLHDCEEFDEDLISSVVEDLYPILQKEFAKTHCHWIYSNWYVFRAKPVHLFR